MIYSDRTVDFGLSDKHVLVTGGSRGTSVPRRAIVVALAGHCAKGTASYANDGQAVATLAKQLGRH